VNSHVGALWSSRDLRYDFELTLVRTRQAFFSIVHGVYWSDLTPQRSISAEDSQKEERIEGCPRSREDSSPCSIPIR
jgi:hypothetical protein